MAAGGVEYSEVDAAEQDDNADQCSPGAICLKCPLAKLFLASFQRFYHTKEYSDVEITCRGECFQAHRVIITAGSGYFQQELNPAKNNGNAVTSLSIDADPRLLDLCIVFMYTGRIEVSPLQMRSIALLAERLDIQLLYHACRAERFRYEDAVPSNCLDMMCTARATGDDNLLRKSRPVALAHVVDLTTDPSFQILCKDCILELLMDDKLKLAAEEQRLNSLLVWVNHDPDSRQSHLSDMLSHLLPHTSTHAALKQLHNYSALQGQDDCQSILREAISALKELSSDIRPRVKSLQEHGTDDDQPEPLFIFARREWKMNDWGKAKSSVMTIDLSHKTKSCIRAKPPSGVPRDGMVAVCATENVVFVSGLGKKGIKCCKYDLVSRDWSRCGVLSFSRRGHCMAVVEGRVYALGGNILDGSMAVKQVELCKKDSPTWHETGDLHGHFCHNACCCVYQGQIIVYGVLNATWKPVLQVFSPTQRSVSHIVSLPENKTVYGVAAVQDYVIMAGDPNTYIIPISGLFQNDPSKVIECCHYRSPNKYCIMTAIGNDLFLIGGCRSLGEHECYLYRAKAHRVIQNHETGWKDIKADWSVGKSMIRPGACCHAQLIGVEQKKMSLKQSLSY